MDGLEHLNKPHNPTPDQHGATLKALHDISAESGSLAWAIESAARAVRTGEPGAHEKLAHAIGAGIVYLRGL